MSDNNIGSIFTSNLSIPGVFNVLDLSYNLFYMEQLVKLGYRIIFDYSWYIMLWALGLLGPSTLLVQHTYTCTVIYLYRTLMPPI